MNKYTAKKKLVLDEVPVGADTSILLEAFFHGMSQGGGDY